MKTKKNVSKTVKDASMQPRPKMVETVDKMTLPQNGTVTIHRGEDPIKAIRKYKATKFTIPLANGNKAVIKSLSRNVSNKDPYCTVSVKDKTHIDVTNARISYTCKDGSPAYGGSYVIVESPSKVVLSTADGDLYLPKKNLCLVYTRITPRNKDMFALDYPKYAKLSDKQLEKSPKYGATRIFGESYTSIFRMMKFLSYEQSDPKPDTPKKSAPSPDALKERRFKKFMKTGLTMDGIFLKECGITPPDPVPKTKRTRELFESLDKHIQEQIGKIEKENKIIAQCYFGGKPMEILSKRTERKIADLRKQNMSIKDIAQKTNLREDTIAFCLAGGYSKPFGQLAIDAKLFWSAHTLDSKLYEEAYQQLMESFSVRMRMDKILASDGIPTSSRK